jgi:hypothetical protein
VGNQSLGKEEICKLRSEQIEGASQEKNRRENIPGKGKN